jgi:hypothetical protein
VRRDAAALLVRKEKRVKERRRETNRRLNEE